MSQMKSTKTQLLVDISGQQLESMLWLVPQQVQLLVEELVQLSVVLVLYLVQQ